MLVWQANVNACVAGKKKKEKEEVTLNKYEWCHLEESAASL